MSRKISLLVLVIFMFFLFPSVAKSQGFGALESFVELHGYADLTYFDFEKDGDPTLPYTDGGGNPTFDNNHFTLFIGANLRENLKFTSEFHFEHGYSEPEMPQANIAWRFTKSATLTFGKFWFPFGTLEEHKVYSPQEKLVSFPYTIANVLPFHWADVGIQFYNKVSIKLMDIGYYLALVNGPSGLSEEDAATRVAGDNNKDKRFVGRVEFYPLEGLEFGVSHTTGKWDTAGENKLDFIGVDAMFNHGKLELTGEYIQGDVESDGNLNDLFSTLDAGSCTANCLSVGDFTRSGYFIQASYTLLEKAHNINYMNATVRYDAFDRDDRVDDNNDLSRFTFGVGVSPYPHFLFKAEYQLVEEEGTGKDNDGVMLQVVADF